MKNGQYWGDFKYPLEIRGPSRTVYREGKTMAKYQLVTLKSSDVKSKNDLIIKEKQPSQASCNG